ncbi:MAG: xanthine dehydrogenase family protein molybdopterin-binding subunit [Acidimicrobiales bacterium]|nr:xanthine dehydrogenase family protein molybdopterin-binding subunit [Acidimicrobiales bacterium]
MSILGNRVLRVEDPKLLTSGGTYVADVRVPELDGAAHITYVRSTIAHANITGMEVDEARQAPGVLGVFTAADIDLGVPPLLPMFNQAMARPLLADGVVRFVGEPVAVIVSERPEQGADASELVWPDYDPLPVIVDPMESARDEVLLHPAAGTNVVLALTYGEDPNLFDGCEVVVSEDIVNQRVAVVPLESRSAAAAWVDGRLWQWSSTQNAHGVRDVLAGQYGLDPAAVRVIAPDVGGGFGAKIGVTPEEVLLGWLARRVGRPVRWSETRSENMVAMGHGRGQWQKIEIGGRRDGTVEAYRLTILQDGGAYPNMGALLPWLTRVMAPGTYVIPRVEVASRAVVTNTTCTVAYRGAGRPEATAAIERAMDIFAFEVGMDPVEVRRKNLIPADAFPYTTATDAVYDSGDYEEALDRVLEGAGYQELRAEQARRREAADVVQMGIGVALYVEITAGPTAGSEHARVVVDVDGSATIYTGTSAHGQGHDTAFATLVSSRLGIPMDKITVVHGDTDLVERGQGTMGSRSLQLGGSAVFEAAAEVITRATQIAARLLEVTPGEIAFDDSNGAFRVAGGDEPGVGWPDVAGASKFDGTPLAASVDFQASEPTFPFGAHLAVVDVDTETGQVRLVRFVAVDDAGRILNPLLAEGQRHGGIAQGSAQALLEEVCFDADGNPVTSNLADYAAISATELPSFELIAMETPTPINPLGAKGIGESGTVGSTPAVQSAVVDALGHLGVRHLDMPATAERVWRAIQDAPSGKGA